MSKIDLGNFSIRDVDNYVKELCPQINLHDLEVIVDNAQSAFWNEISSEFPKVRSGDFEPMQSVQFDLWCKIAVAWWLNNNWPKIEDELSPILAKIKLLKNAEDEPSILRFHLTQIENHLTQILK